MIIIKRILGGHKNYNLEEDPANSEFLAKKPDNYIAKFLKGFWEFSIYYGRFIAYHK